MFLTVEQKDGPQYPVPPCDGGGEQVVLRKYAPSTASASSMQTAIRANVCEGGGIV